MPRISLKKFKAICDDFYRQKILHIRNENKYKEIKATVIKYLVDHEIDSIAASKCKLSLVNSEKVQVPKDPKQKKLLFNWIKKTYGPKVLMGLVTINDKAFNVFYADCSDESGSLNFKMPGVQKPFEVWTVSARKK